MVRDPPGDDQTASHVALYYILDSPFHSPRVGGLLRGTRFAQSEPNLFEATICVPAFHYGRNERAQNAARNEEKTCHHGESTGFRRLFQ